MSNPEQSIQLANLVNTGRPMSPEEDVYGLIPDFRTGFSQGKPLEVDLVGVNPKDLAPDLELDPSLRHDKAMILTELGVPVIAVVEQHRGLNQVDRVIVNLYPPDAPVTMFYEIEEGGPYGQKQLANDLKSQLVIPFSDNAQLNIAKVKNEQGTGFEFIVSLDQGV